MVTLEKRARACRLCVVVKHKHSMHFSFCNAMQFFFSNVTKVSSNCATVACAFFHSSNSITTLADACAASTGTCSYPSEYDRTPMHAFIKGQGCRRDLVR